MKNYDWKNSFPEPPQEFHEKLCHTLDNLEVKEKGKMKKFTFKKGLIIAAAAVLVIGSAAIATQGTTRVVTGSSWAVPTYKEIPSAEKLEKDIGITPKILSEFSNGYTFDSATKVDNAIEDLVDGSKRVVVVENGKEQKFKSLSINYKNEDDKITLDAEPADFDIEKKASEAENYNGISIGYTAFTNKFVPGNYQQTEQDIKDEAEGKYVFSYGTDDIEIHEVQGVTWIQDGIKYHINAMDSPLNEQELIDIAKEIIDFQ
jgi:hypothetical protein